MNDHNKKILQPKPAELQKLYNCLVKEDCPINGLCLTSSVLYQTTIKCSDSKYKQKMCKGICDRTFKKRYGNHEKSFNLINLKVTPPYLQDTGPYNKNSKPRAYWEIKGQYKAYKPILKKCNFYLMKHVSPPKQV